MCPSLVFHDLVICSSSHSQFRTIKLVHKSFIYSWLALFPRCISFFFVLYVAPAVLSFSHDCECPRYHLPQRALFYVLLFCPPSLFVWPSSAAVLPLLGSPSFVFFFLHVLLLRLVRIRLSYLHLWVTVSCIPCFRLVA